jgi:dimethylglycine catabolism B
MRELPVVKVDGVVELDHAVIDGIDVSGSWNRMFTQRSITEYPTEAMDWVTGLDGGESMRDCYQCGKCVPVCPVNHVGDYGPRKLNVKVLRGNDLVDDPDLWLCTTCGACYRVCPKEVNPLRIMPAIREQAVLQGKVPDELADTFQKLQRTGNPLGESPRKRAEWSADAGVPVPLISEVGRPVDVLWYVSDYTSYHPRGKDAARAMARVLTALGVDFAILGPEERSDGDSARLAGESGLFEMLAEQNIRTFSKYEFQRLVVMDPHAYNAFRNHYPGLGWQGDVLHYTQLLAPLVDRIAWRSRVELDVTYHDPCYLGRNNGEYDAPRTLLEAIPGIRLAEMPHTRANGYCCGGGGGGMWLDGFVADHVSERLSERRVREAVATVSLDGAGVLSVACPYEPSRFEDAVKSTGNDGRLVVRDIIELIDQAMQPPAS